MSYGRISHELYNAFTALGIHTNTVGEHAPETRFQPCFGSIVLGYPTDTKTTYPPITQLGKRLIVTMWETDTLPKGWTEALNDFDAVIVPTQWNVDVFRANGVTSPIHVVPLGINSDFKYIERPLERKVHRFLAIEANNERKNWRTIIEAFYRAFGNDPHYRLIFKNRQQAYSHMANGYIPDENISVMEHDLPIQALARFYGDFDYMVFPSLGEGFGLPPREFVATGGIAIATNWGGLSEGIHEWGYPLEIEGLIPAKFSDLPANEHLNVGSWGSVAVDTLALAMRDVVANRDEYLLKAKQQSDYVVKTYTWKSFTDRVLEIWQDLDGDKRTADLF